MIKEEFPNDEKTHPINFRFYEIHKLRKVISQVDRVAQYVEVENIFQCKRVLKAASSVVTKKRSLNNQIGEIMKNSHKLQCLDDIKSKQDTG